MAIQLKTKIALGGIFLFALTILVGVVSFFYLNRVSFDAKTIVQDNYESLNYSRHMLNILDSTNEANWHQRFDQELRLQEQNITEPGESDATMLLRYNFDHLRASGKKIDSLELVMRKTVSQIMDMNLKSIDQKNQAAQKAAEEAQTIINIILTVSLLMGFTFLFSFPSLVAEPVSKLTAAIKGIANKNYSERIHLKRKDEFGELAEAFNTMAERLDGYEHSNLARILFEKQRAEAVINSLKDASIGIDSKGIVLFANHQALQLLHLKDTEIVGHDQEEIRKKNDLFRYLIEEQGNVPFKIVVDKRENYFIKEVVELQNDNQGAGIVIVLKNITSFKELDVAKTNFIATISHELKTPLASSDFSLKLLEDARTGNLSNEQQELVNLLKQDNQRMLKILSELLNMSQAEAGRIQLDVAATNPLHILENAIHAVLNTAKERDIVIQKKYAEDIGAVMADGEKTAWVLNNFLTNALKHAPAKSTIEAGFTRVGNTVSFFVTDNGPGIPAEYHARIFERFFKVPGSKTKGTGIGLSISKEFIEAQGGEIWVRSEANKGSTFGFNLPLTIS